MRRLLLVSLLAVLLVPAAAHGTSSPGIVISQVYAGGGNSGAAYANDFVELLNTNATAVDLNGWSLQYASAASTSWSVTALSGTVQPGRYFLVGLASSGAVGAALPAADASGTTNMAVSGGKVALVHDISPLACGASAGSCAGDADFVGYGTATDYEGSAAPAGSATLAIVRGAAGCTDTDQNGTDFDTAAPAPRNSASAAASCSGAAGSTSTKDVAVDVDVQTVLSLSLQHASLSFGSVAAGDTPSSLGDQLTVVSNSATGYAISIHRSAFTPADLPLAVSSTAPTGGAVGSGLAGGALARIPVSPAADLLLGTTSARSAASGDLWPASVGFASALPVVPAGHYTATVTFTVIGR